MSATVFRNARIIDGTGDAPFSADVRVVGNRIVGDRARRTTVAP